MANEVVLGELGWWSLKGRRDLLRLKYWGHLVRVREDSVVKRVYRESRNRYSLFAEENWCTYTHLLLKKLDMDSVWVSEVVGGRKEWSRVCFDKMRIWEEAEWNKRRASKPKLRLYNIVKSKLEIESYLNFEVCNRYGRKLLTQLRGGMSDLRVEKGRWEGEKLEKRLCRLCFRGVEDERHFLLECEVYGGERKKLRDGMMKKSSGVCDIAKDSDYALRVLLSGDVHAKLDLAQLWKLVKCYIVDAMRIRNRCLYLIEI